MKVWKFSKYITAAVLLTIAVGGWTAYKTVDNLGNSTFFPRNEEERAELLQKRQAQYIWPTSDYYRLSFVNLEKDYYAVQQRTSVYGEPSYYRIVDRNGQTIKDLAEYEISFVWDEYTLYGHYSRDYVTACDEEQEYWYVIDRDTLEVYPAGKNYITMHPETGYYIPESDANYIGYQVCSPEGEILWESEDPIRMASQPGYLIRMPEGQDVTQIVEMETGAVIYESFGTEVIEDYDHGFIWISGMAPGWNRDGEPAALSCHYLLGPDFKPALDGRIFSSREIYITDEYICGVAFIGGYLDGANNHEVADGQWNHTVVAYDHEGKLLFEGKQGDSLLNPPYGDTLAVYQQNRKYMHVKLTEGGAV